MADLPDHPHVFCRIGDRFYMYPVIDTTKETAMHKIKIKVDEREVRGGLAGTRTGPTVALTVEASGDTTPDDLQKIVAIAQVATAGVSAAAGILPYERPPEVERAEEKPEAERPRDPEDEDLSGVADEALERGNRRMYDAIGSAMENIQDIAKELQDEETPPGEERIKVLGRTLNTIVDSLGSSRV